MGKVKKGNRRQRSQVGLKKPGGKSVAKDGGKPKRPLTAYMQFIRDFRKKNSHRGWKVTEVVCRGAEVWKKLTAHEKGPYEKMAAKDQTDYQKKMRSFCNKNQTKASKQDMTDDEMFSSDEDSDDTSSISVSSICDAAAKPGASGKGKSTNKQAGASAKSRLTTNQRKGHKASRGKGVKRGGLRGRAKSGAGKVGGRR